MYFRSIVAAGLVWTLGLSAHPPQTYPQSPSTRFGAAAAGVVVDVVVRDSKGRPVTDLAAKDFEIFEDGVRQKVVGFEQYAAGDAATTVAEATTRAGIGKPSAAGSRWLAEGPPIIVVAWDRLEPEGRSIAHKAARRVVETKAPDELIGVFLTDRTLQTIQPYTTDASRLATAVEELASTATTNVKRESLPLDSYTRRAATAPTEGAAESGMSTAGFPMQVITEDDRGTRALLRALNRMELDYLQYLHEEQGRASILGLLALVNSLGELPGRKTLLYFCEGLTIPDSQQSRFRQVIDSANRNNVSIYTFDSAGLRVQSAQQKTAREVREFTFTGLGIERMNTPTGELSSNPGKKLTEDLENNERVLKMDPAVSLGILADQTGGLLSNNTNALERAIDRINDDRRHHYLLSYVSTNSVLDGTYRQIVVSVNKPGVEVRARRGYRASPAGMSTPLLEYELPAMAALASSPAPSAFPIAALALRTPMPDRRGLVSLLVAVGGRSLAVARSDDGLKYSAGATVLARVVTPDTREVARVSQQYRFTGDYARREEHRRGVLFFRTASLAPGQYTLEAVVHDVVGEQSAVKRLTIEGSSAGEGTLVGDLFVATHVGPAPERKPEDDRHPLEWNGQLYTPSIGEALSLSNRPDLTVVLPVVVVGDVPNATLEVRVGEGSVTGVSVTAGHPDPHGRLMFVGRIPLDHLSAGDYAAVMRLSQGSEATVRTIRFTLVP